MIPDGRPPRSTPLPARRSALREPAAKRGRHRSPTGGKRARSYVRPADSRERADYLEHVRGLLWPEASPPQGEAADRQAGIPARARFLIAFPSADRPRIVIPAARLAAAAAVRRYGEPSSMRTLVATRGLSLLLRAGAGSILGDKLAVATPAGMPTIESYLRQQLGPDIHVSMHIGAARANRKPVLQLLTTSGTTVGFAKIGADPLTKELVRAERDALADLSRSRLTRLQVPQVLHSGRWGDLDVLVLSPLPVWQRRIQLGGSQLISAMQELSEVAGTSREPLTGSRYWQRLTARLDATDDSADRRALLRALSQLPARAGGIQLTFGSWHGDWTSWNMASTRVGLLVWDWERFACGVPIGFDALHHWLQARVVGARADPRASAADCIRLAPEILAPFGTDAAQARTTALAYVADLAVRYLADRQAEAGARLGAPGRWLIPALAAWAAHL